MSLHDFDIASLSCFCGLIHFFFVFSFFFFLMIRRPPRSTLDRSSAASDVYKRQILCFVLIDWFKEILIPYAHSFPLPPLAFGAAFFEELIPPIPGFTLMIMIGSFARIQDLSLIHISEPTRPY